MLEEAVGIIAGVVRKIHYFAMDLPHSDACFVAAYRHGSILRPSRAGVRQSILYENTKLGVARILDDDKRQRTRVFCELQSHCLLEDRLVGLARATTTTRSTFIMRILNRVHSPHGFLLLQEYL